MAVAANSSPEVELLVLEFLQQSGGPLGCGAVSEYLRRHGHSVSEATAGRLLRDLDAQGYTTRVGYRGRALTDSGVARLAMLRQSVAMSAYSSDLLEVLSVARAQEVVDILVARKCLERETARLAAERASEADLAELEAALRRYEEADSPEAAARADLDFHNRLAAISGNRVLEAVLRLIRGEVETTPLPSAVVSRIQPRLAREHWEILDAIRSRDPDRAERAMLAHIEGIIRDVRAQAVSG